jgi:REP element-mobilizing transposase RayT
MHISGEYYHIYNRGAHKAPIFNDKSDYERFLALLYLANSEDKLSFNRTKPDQIFSCTRPNLVGIFAYCLMPNHFHIGIIEMKPDGIKRFIHKLCTAYAMYYNKKYSHSGTIFQGEYRSKRVDDDGYLRYLVQYIHLNPFGIEEPELMKTAKPEHLKEALECSRKYDYSSFKDYLGEERPQKTILTHRVTEAGA